MKFSEEHILQVLLCRRESVIEHWLGKYMNERLSADQLIGDHAIVLLILRELLLYYTLLPHLSSYLRKSIISAPTEKHPTIVHNSHVGAKLPHVLNNVRRQDNDHILPYLT